MRLFERKCPQCGYNEFWFNNDDNEPQSLPFEGILGNNCELRLVQFLLPLKGIDFNITELAEEIDISRVIVTKVVKKFADWGLLLKRRSGNATYYSINLKSPIVASIQKFNNALIEVMLGDEELYKIHDYWESNKNRPNPSTVGLSRNTCLDAADTTTFTFYVICMKCKHEFSVDCIPTWVINGEY